MSNYMLRRRGLGRQSCRAFSQFSTTGIGVVRNDDMDVIEHNGIKSRLTPELTRSDEDVVFRWGTTSLLSLPALQYFHEVRVVNTADAIHRVNDKRGFRLTLAMHGLSPPSWGDLADVTADARYPLVVRPAHHARGVGVHLCHDFSELEKACDLYDEYYISEYIRKDAEYRVMVICGRVAWVARKTPGNPDDVAWNVARGGRFDNVRWGDWPLRVCNAAVSALALSGLHFGGVDVMVKDGVPYVLEINSAPSHTSEYRQQCTARCFDYIVQNGRADIYLGTLAEDSWRNYIHPAISEQASMP